MNIDIENIAFDEKGLIPVIAQDAFSGEIRMLAYANKEAIKKTIETGYAHYFSRSRNSIWKKGETSGELQEVLEIRIDCDNDTLIYMIKQQKDIACHTGNRNCFFRAFDKEKPSLMPFEILPFLERLIKDRISNPVENSYTSKLIKEGLDRIVQKVGEEAIESVIAFKNQDKKEIAYELADLIYHILVGIKYSNMSFEDIELELIRRHKS
ncbi:MAG: bifunctional phosphoribosyl-AMP cyclohydrolase/phosphoribosyl-ATP diphosphatase HisIE [Hydrogenobaculum sp.]|jgi:phosphoribosyl-ATP pyrophosphatase (EC 3.6.1.31)/phosphoribosyl-AMP cyclohydrolase (EC 3.5.4.19)|uniref:bifunctional phosphoribosyl-AMP cyclohydrolase/phosphoribosyl-ATP diphosphatase HisIE n=1 Tax=unclassified Hydrogenobaculum TaxID=2622382 RepID=UPI0001C506E4|nr:MULTISPECIES: bifunctional phosphoribosyl-AMP cyclohydrolase/phosphoribosyl-ATP diphosphatase HisIE [unclassified Hydrogenobaculum]AEF19245.1 phosphoribosyl-ATP diphosphatase [Hydrogenobaculum sp. 3684]AEG46534.1 Histidine biosynthesis bifunctional protein hisIE [Hydrogenobaculum sp. SHO]AGG15179.1 phosphoribosyl-AMP cyclohydrolase [Hydrogenobaculum sp. HO]AGH93477.1 phosphoribosyl-AMP cyclohydrolase; phosphoribosyl-ATP pyrophosphatase [Hydrogenobaculum sp. SN]